MHKNMEQRRLLRLKRCFSALALACLCCKTPNLKKLEKVASTTNLTLHLLSSTTSFQYTSVYRAVNPKDLIGSRAIPAIDFLGALNESYNWETNMSVQVVVSNPLKKQ